MAQRIYLDNAATSWPKPDSVYDAVDRYQRQLGAPGSRAGYREAIESDRILSQARQGVARLIGAADAKQVIFTSSCTESLNLALRGILEPGDHVVTTVCEHNSVLRPLHELQKSRGITMTLVPCDGQGYVSPADIRQAITPATRLVAVLHASNVTGAVQPIEEIGKIAKQREALFLVDAAQTLGHVPVDVEAMDIDLLAAPGHKGLLGPLGTGVLYIRPGLESQLDPLCCGGTGSQSELPSQPQTMPDKFEAGNHNMPGIAGLAAALEWLESRGFASLQQHHEQLTSHLLQGLQSVPGLEILGPRDTSNRVSVVSFRLAGYDPQELAALLDASGGIQCRAGLHCAPLMHQALGTLESGGTVRLSPGWSTRIEDVDHMIEILNNVAAIAN